MGGVRSAAALRPGGGSCVDLDDSHLVQVSADVAEYVTAVLAVTAHPADRIVSAARLIADALVTPAEGVDPFLRPVSTTAT